ncbi:HD domain-containing protein [Burkholderia multivorans]|uniref:HD domain-containing protein n=1 Tax=Burkholderia multivorans TaxID=87883 RepID=UPI000D007319|nr:HD domain-containing protein [Burkholderia multivorans]MDN7969208.1 HD domain-containing protein [Burkholderia multivorans]PRG24457.1 phosphohydrolase [Burkholderia multivorans]
MNKLIAAIAFAADRHRNQRREDEEASPYINHPIALADVLANEVGIEDERVIVAAVLHDTIEDTETTEQELLRLFGKDVADIVLEVTDDKSLPKETRKRLQIEHAAHISRRAKLVKLADKICNLRDLAQHPPAEWPLERKQAYFDWAKSVVDRMRGVHPGLEAIFDAAYAARPSE